MANEGMPADSGDVRGKGRDMGRTSDSKVEKFFEKTKEAAWARPCRNFEKHRTKDGDFLEYPSKIETIRPIQSKSNSYRSDSQEKEEEELRKEVKIEK